MVNKLKNIRDEWVDAFLLECNPQDIKNDDYTKSVAKQINHLVEQQDKAIKHLLKLAG